MSTPFPLEEQSQTDRLEPVWNPWQGQPSPHWYSGMGFNEDTAYLGPIYRALEAAGSGAAKGEALLGAVAHGWYGLQAAVMEALHIPGAEIPKAQQRDADEILQEARDRVKAMTPDPATTGTAVQLLHGIGESAWLATVGGLAGGPLASAALVGGAQGVNRYEDLTTQGVIPGAATASAALTGVTSAAGVLMPAGFGSTLLSRVMTGAVGNVGFGVVNRYADHAILEHAGYPEMAAQQKPWDATQILTDAILGGAFGALSHFHSKAEADKIAALREEPGMEDAAMTAKLAMKDQQAGPGVAVDPEAAAAHQAALEKATSDLLQGKPVDVSETGVNKATFVSRPTPDLTEPEAMLVKTIRESGLLDEELNMRALDEALTGRQGKTLDQSQPEPIAPIRTPAEIVPKEPTSAGPQDIASQALAERPDMQIPDETGKPVNASDALAQASDTTQKQDWVTAVKSAVNCFNRRGG